MEGFTQLILLLSKSAHLFAGEKTNYTVAVLLPNSCVYFGDPSWSGLRHCRACVYLLLCTFFLLFFSFYNKLNLLVLVIVQKT